MPENSLEYLYKKEAELRKILEKEKEILLLEKVHKPQMTEKIMSFQYDEIDKCENEKKNAWNHAGNDSARFMQLGKPVLGPFDGKDSDQDHDNNHRRMPAGEKEAHTPGVSLLLHQLAHHIVYGRDVVGVKRMTKPQGIG